MAQYKLLPQEFVKNAFAPQIAVMCSPTVERVCKKNNLSFVELVQPFCKLSADVNLQDPSGGIFTIHNLKVTLIDIGFHPPAPALARKFLNTVVSQAWEPRSQTIQAGEYNLEIPATAPWFEAWRDMFLQVQYPSDHEFTKHYVACMLVVSSPTKPLETMHDMNNQLDLLLSEQSNELPKWFNSSSLLRYYVIIHDVCEVRDDKATQALEAFKVAFGINNCFLLRINSRRQGQMDEQLPDPWSQYISCNFEIVDGMSSSPDSSPRTPRVLVQPSEEVLDVIDPLPYHPLSPDTAAQTFNEALLERTLLVEPPVCNTLHGMCLTTEDVEQIKLLIHEFCTRALLPYIERQIQALTETVSNKKGVSKSLLSATKRWFTPSKAGSSVSSPNLPVYAPDAAELQMRKLADLYFMFCHYSNAFHVYHTAKRDFNADQAWFYYAGALEMASIAAFMIGDASRKTCDYIEESINNYLNVCKMAQFATRATLISAEILKTRGLYGEAAHQLIRMTSEESDLRSALLLEQAAYCFLNSVHAPMLRKYAFHMVLAGHRFSKAAQKKHALRCYKQALEVYRGKGWTFAEDHVHYTIGKLSTGLNYLQEASDSFAKLLTIQSKQSVEQQTLFLKEYLSIQRLLRASAEHQELPVLLLPILKSEFTKILVGPTPPLSIPGKVRAFGVTFDTCDDAETRRKWAKLEEMVVQEAQGSLPLIFKPAITLYSKENINYSDLIAIVNEPIQVSVRLHNTLSVLLNLRYVHLLWSFKDEHGTVISNEGNCANAEDFVKTNELSFVVIHSNCSNDLVLFITPLVVGELHLKGIFYEILDLDLNDTVSTVAGKQLFDFKKNLRKEVAGVNVSEDLGLPIAIKPPAPSLQVNFEEVNIGMLCNEIKPVSMEMRNVGSVPLHKVYVATSTPQFLSSCEFRDTKLQFREVVDLDNPAVKERMGRKNHVTEVVLPNGCLQPGHSYSVNIWLKAPNVKGPVWVDLLIYYENCDSTSVPRYRIIRHIWNLKVYESLEIQCNITEGSISQGVKELLFAIKAINLCMHYSSKLIDITLLRAGCLSSRWKLKPLKYAFDIGSRTIHPEQSAYFLLKGERCNTDYNKYSEVSLLNLEPVTKNLPYVDFAKGLEQTTRVNIFEELPIAYKRFSTSEGTLFFHWEARITDSSKNESTVRGQTYVSIEKYKMDEENSFEKDGQVVLYDPNQPVESQTPNKEKELTEELRNQISLSMSHSSNICHNFEENQICIIPVKMSIHNDSDVRSVITLDTSDMNSSPSKPNIFCPHPSKDYQWVGFNGTVRAMPPLSSAVINLNVAVSVPGVYDLTRRLKLWCQNELYSKPVLQLLQPLGFLTVKSSVS